MDGDDFAGDAEGEGGEAEGENRLVDRCAEVLPERGLSATPSSGGRRGCRLV
jgi:hypothetical protein